MMLNLTYDELSERLGITRNAARVLAQRRKWSRYTSQDDGKARVRVPDDELERMGAQRGEHGAAHEPPHAVPPPDGEIEALKAHVQTMCEMLKLKDAAHAAELERLRGDLKEACKEAEGERRHSRDLYERLDQIHREHRTELERMLTEWERERARLQAELEEARRPWFRRWFGW